MKKASTYRQITLIFGVIVALIIMVTLWMRNPENVEASTPAMLEMPSVPKAVAPSVLLKLSAKAHQFVKAQF